jgi:hypothetical protein
MLHLGQLQMITSSGILIRTQSGSATSNWRTNVKCASFHITWHCNRLVPELLLRGIHVHVIAAGDELFTASVLTLLLQNLQTDATKVQVKCTSVLLVSISCRAEHAESALCCAVGQHMPNQHLSIIRAMCNCIRRCSSRHRPHLRVSSQGASGLCDHTLSWLWTVHIGIMNSCSAQSVSDCCTIRAVLCLYEAIACLPCNDSITWPTTCTL